MSDLPDKPTELIEKTGDTFNKLLPSLDKYVKGALLLMLLLLTMTFCISVASLVLKIEDPGKLIPVKRNNEACFKLEDGRTYCPEG